ncbi:MAG: glycosyltransferase family 4 protein [Candidatus Helarchaeota archaeon]
MKILIVPELDWLASLQNRIQKISDRISKNNQVHVIYFKHHKSNIKRSIKLKKNIYLHKPTIVFFKNKLIYYIVNIIPTFNYIYKIIKNYKIDLIVSTNFLIAPFCIVISKITKIPFVFDLVDFQPYHIHYLTYIPKFIRKIGIFILSQLLKFDIKKADHVITTGIPLFHIAKMIKGKSVSIVSNGVDPNLFKSDIYDENIRKKYELGDLNIGFVGALEYWVDFNYLFKAISILKEDYQSIKLFLIGPSENLGLNKIKYLAWKYNVINNIIFTGRVPYKKIPAYINMLDFCIVPFVKNYLTECIIPMKIFEYLACGCPVISVPLAGIKSVFKDSIYYAATPLQVRKIVDVLMKKENIFSNKWSSLVRKYDWEDLSKKYCQILKDVLTRSESKINN